MTSERKRNESRSRWSVNQVLTNAHSKFYLRCYFNELNQNTEGEEEKL